MLVAEVHTATPRSTKDTAALREVNFFSRFSIRTCWDTYVVKTRLPGSQTIVQPIPGIHPSKVSRQLTIFGKQRIEDDEMPGSPSSRMLGSGSVIVRGT